MNKELGSNYYKEIIGSLMKIVKIRFRSDFNYNESNKQCIKIEKIICDLVNLTNNIELSLIEIQNNAEKYIDIEEKNKNLEKTINTYESLLNAYKTKIVDQENKIKESENFKFELTKENKMNNFFENEIQVYKNKIIDFEKKINTIHNEKENLKTQNLNMNSLLKQLTLEKNSKENDNYNEFEKKICFLRKQIEKAKEDYDLKLKKRDKKIQNLLRQIKLIEKENLLKADIISMENLNPNKILKK